MRIETFSKFKYLLAAMCALFTVLLCAGQSFAAEPVSVTMEARQLVVEELADLETEYTFTALDNAPAPAKAANGVYSFTLTGNALETIVIDYTHAGVFDYKLTAAAVEDAECANDEYSVRVYVYNQNDGSLKPEINATKKDGSKGDNLTFRWNLPKDNGDGSILLGTSGIGGTDGSGVMRGTHWYARHDHLCLFDIIFTIINIILCTAMAVQWRKKTMQTAVGVVRLKKRKNTWLVSVVPTAISVAMFIVKEDILSPLSLSCPLMLWYLLTTVVNSVLYVINATAKFAVSSKSV